MARRLGEWRHGTYYCYVYRKCRCDDCREAWRVYMSEYRRRQREREREPERRAAS